ncbi:MAG: IS3 family transposase [Bacteroidales bacterium]
MSNGVYSSVRITMELCQSGNPISRPTVQKYMRELGLRSVLTKKFKISTTDLKHSNHTAENLLARNFNVLEPNKFWVVKSNSRKGNCWDNALKKLTMPLNFLCGLGLLVQWNLC